MTDKERIVELEKDIQWYAMWHKQFQQQIEQLKTELETYRPTKLKGEGQCKCYNCQQINWTNWCSSYKGRTYCDTCLKEILYKEPQNAKVVEALKKVKDKVPDFDGYDDYDCMGMYEFIDRLIKELGGKNE